MSMDDGEFNSPRPSQSEGGEQQNLYTKLALPSKFQLLLLQAYNIQSS